jgi:hypothetical protein
MSDRVPTAAAAEVWNWDSAGPTAPNPARMYDYYLGGKDNFRVDRDAAEAAVAAQPVIPVLARANRAFLVDAVRQMAAAGVSQYLDVGSGLPTSPNVHEVASETVAQPHVVYVDIDPVVVSHSRVMRGHDGTATVLADLRAPAAVLGAPEVERLIDFSRPCGLLMMSVLHFVSGDIAPLVAEYTSRLAPGSFLALSHVVIDGADLGTVSGVAEVYEKSPADPEVRTTAAVRQLFDGFELLAPGLTDVRTYTDPGFVYSPDAPAPGIWMLCAVGLKR